MRALHILKDLEPGGIQILLLDMLTNRRYFEGELALFVMGKGRLHKQFRSIKGLKIYQWQRKMKIDYQVIRALQNAVVDFEAELIHTHHTAEMFHGWWAMRKFPKVKKAHTFHVSPEVFTLPDKLLNRWIAPHFDLLLAPSHAQAQALSKAGIRKKNSLQVLYNGIDPKRVQSKLSQKEARHKLQLPEKGYLIGMAGSFYNQIRDQETLCRAMAKVESTKEEVYLVFAGATHSDYFKKSAYYQHCKALCEKLGISERVSFLGNVAQVSTFYRSLDLYVHCSRRDTFGLAVLEAQQSGLPVIVYNTELNKELWQPNLWQISNVITTSEENVANAIQEAIDHKDSPVKAGMADKFSIGEHLAHLSHCYRSI